MPLTAAQHGSVPAASSGRAQLQISVTPLRVATVVGRGPMHNSAASSPSLLVRALTSQQALPFCAATVAFGSLRLIPLHPVQRV